MPAAREIARRQLLDDPAALHHGDPIGDLRYHREIVTDENHRLPPIVRKSLQEAQNLRLRAGIERGGRLVGDEQRWPEHRGCRDRDPLPLASGQFIRIAVERTGGVRKTDPVERLARRLGCLTGRHPMMQSDGFRNLIADAPQRIERGHGLLKDHADLPAADSLNFALAHAGQQLLAQPHLARGSRTSRQEPHDAQCSHRFSRSRAAHQAEDFSRRHRERYPVENQC